MGIIKFENLAAAKRFKQSLLARHRMDYDVYQRHCRRSGIPVCNKCLSFEYTSKSLKDGKSFEYTCKKCNNIYCNTY